MMSVRPLGHLINALADCRCCCCCCCPPSPAKTGAQQWGDRSGADPHLHTQRQGRRQPVSAEQDHTAFLHPFCTALIKKHGIS
jgi:hypothetical protein